MINPMDAMDRAEKMTELTSIQDMAISRGDAVARIEELLAEEESLEVRQEATRAVASYPEHPALWAKVLGLAREEPGPLRETALSTLGQLIREGDLAGAEEEGYVPDEELGEPRGEDYRAAKELLLERLADPASPAEAQAALASLSYLAHEEAVVEGIAAELVSEERGARERALRCVARGGDERWEGAIVDALVESDDSTMLAAIVAAGGTERVLTAPLLTRILRSARQPDPNRTAAAEALAALGGRVGAPALLEMAESDETGPAREAAREALDGLTLLGASRETVAHPESDDA
jgi:hypothetical protein